MDGLEFGVRVFVYIVPPVLFWICCCVTATAGRPHFELLDLLPLTMLWGLFALSVVFAFWVASIPPMLI